MSSIQNKCRQILHNWGRHTENMHRHKDAFLAKLKQALGDEYKSDLQSIIGVVHESYKAWAGNKAIKGPRGKGKNDDNDHGGVSEADEEEPPRKKARHSNNLLLGPATPAGDFNKTPLKLLGVGLMGAKELTPAEMKASAGQRSASSVARIEVVDMTDVHEWVSRYSNAPPFSLPPTSLPVLDPSAPMHGRDKEVVDVGPVATVLEPLDMPLEGASVADMEATVADMEAIVEKAKSYVEDLEGQEGELTATIAETEWVWVRVRVSVE